MKSSMTPDKQTMASSNRKAIKYIDKLISSKNPIYWVFGWVLNLILIPFILLFLLIGLNNSLFNKIKNDFKN